MLIGSHAAPEILAIPREDRPCRTLSRSHSVQDDGPLAAFQMVEQSQAGFAGFNDLDLGAELRAQPTGRMETHGIIAQDLVAQRQNDRAGFYRRISRMTPPWRSRKVTTKGISPGSVCVAQPKHGS